MFKKGLVTLVCLTVMSALWSWATSTYSVSTKINSLGTKATVVNGKTVYVPIVGGNIKTRIVGAPDGSYVVDNQTNGIKYSTITTDKDLAVDVTADADYKIASVTKTVDGVTSAVNAAANALSYTETFDKPAIDGKTQFLTVTFAARTESTVESKTWQLQVTNNNAGGVIALTRAGVTTNVSDAVKPRIKNYIDTTPVTVTATASDGYFIDYVVVNGVKDNSDRASFTAIVNGANRLNTFNVGYKKKSIPVITTNVIKKDANGQDMYLDVDHKLPVYDDLGIAPVNPVVDPYGNVRLIITPTGKNNTVTEVTTTAGVLALTDRFGAPVTELPFAGPLKATITGIKAPTTTVTVTATYGFDPALNAAYSSCTQTCHIDPNLAPAVKSALAGADTQWNASAHRTAGIDCVSCHKTMPGPDFSTVAAKDALCASCHSNVNASYPAAKYELHTAAQNSCSVCHTFTGHTPIKTNIGTAALHSGGVCSSCHSAAGQVADHRNGLPFNKAQYLSTASLPVTCANCHGESANASRAIALQYAGSAHADTAGEAWLHFDWRGANRSNCARCHNGSAFVAKLGNENNTSSVFQPGDILKPGEVLACTACHTDAATGELRQAPQAFILNVTNGTATFDVAGASALCVRCHSGRETGDSITADANTTGIRVFADVHYQPAGGVLYNKGYDYGQNSDLGAHNLLGAAGQGPCVTCHMPGKNHSFAAASCATCHDGTIAPSVDAATLKANYDAALHNLKLALAAKGIHYAPVHPFFFTAPYDAGKDNTPVTDWSAAYGAANWKNTMGAAYNYNLLWSEKGAYAHNYTYAMKLIADSIDFMDNGVLGQ